MQRKQPLASSSQKAIKALPMTLIQEQRQAVTANVKICEVYRPFESEMTTEASVPVTTASSPTGVGNTESSQIITVGKTGKALKIRRIDTVQRRASCDKETMTDPRKNIISSQLTALLKEVKEYKALHSNKLHHLSTALQTCEGEVRTLTSSVSRMLETPSCDSLRASVELLTTKVSHLQSAQLLSATVTSRLSKELADCKSSVRATPLSLKTTPAHSHNSTPSLSRTPQPSSRYSLALQTLKEISHRAERTLAFSVATRRRLGAN